MTNVDVMEAGSEMDAAIAERVMECGWIEHVDPWYSRDMGAAWLVVRELMALDFWPTLNYLCGVAEPSDKPAWFARFRCVRGGTRGDHWAVADTPELALCRAALKAVQPESQEVGSAAEGGHT